VSDPEGGSLTCELDANGDGTVETVVDDCAGSGTYAFTFSDSGVFHSRLLARDERGQTAEMSIEVFSNHLEFSDAVVFPEQMRGFVSAEVTGSEVLLDFEDPAVVPDLSTGAVLWGVSGEGYVRRVTSAVREGSRLRVATVAAPIDETIVVGTYGVHDLSVPLDEPECLGECEAVATSVMIEDDGDGSEKDVSVGVELEIPEIEVDPGRISLRGSITARLTVTRFVLDIGLAGLREFAFEVTPLAELNVSIAVTAPGARVRLFSRELGRWGFGAIPLGFLVFVPQLEPRVTASAGLEPELTVGATLSLGGTGGVGYRDSAPYAFARPRVDGELLAPEVELGGGELRAGFGPGISIRLMGVAGPGIWPVGYAQVELTADFTEPNVCLEASAGAEAEIGIDMDLFLVRLRATATETLAEVPLGEPWCVDLPAAADGDADTDADSDADTDSTPECTRDEQCLDTEDCTRDTCSRDSFCVHTPLPERTACASDSNGCTDDVCLSGRCEHPPIADGTECSTDADICTIDQCLSGACDNSVRVPGCCTGDPDCVDGPPDTVGQCDLGTNTCMYGDCLPTTTLVCACPRGGEGTQMCLDDMTWGACAGCPLRALFIHGTFIPCIDETLRAEGFEVTTGTVVPSDLSPYALVVLEGYGASNPIAAGYLADYMAEGGGVITTEGVPFFLAGSTDLRAILGWFGAGSYSNSGGRATVTVDHPLGTDLLTGDELCSVAFANATVGGLVPDATVVGRWADSNIFAFYYDNGVGRSFYEAIDDCSLPNLRTLFAAGARWAARIE
jgi:hypothetical protein